jgi:beta-galactosidase/beta-glucuronidase
MRKIWTTFSIGFMVTIVSIFCMSCGEGGTEQPGLNSVVAQRGQMSLDGIWKFRIDPNDTGINEGWYAIDYEDASWEESTVPGNWNFLFREYLNPLTDHDYDVTAWYRTTFVPPSDFKGSLVKLHFGAVCYKTSLWINGQKVGDHEGTANLYGTGYKGKSYWHCYH